MRVEVAVERRLAPRADRDLVRRVAEQVLRLEGVAGPARVGVHLVSDETIRELNRRYRGIDRVTDVLSFPLTERGAAPFVLPPRAPLDLGDVVVSYARAVEQARQYGHGIERELGYLVAHGVLHLLGYDHETEADRKVMREREEAALAAVGLVR